MKNEDAAQNPVWLAPRDRRRVEAVLCSQSACFSDLIKTAGLNPTTDFRFANLSAVDFYGSDLRGYDFTGANLSETRWFCATWDKTTILKDSILTDSRGLESIEFLIVHSSADQALAEELMWSLQDLHRVVFLDDGAIRPGARWDERLAGVLAHSHAIAVLVSAVVVLVSKESGKAPYHREAMARAIAEMRADPGRKRVVPVMLPGATAADVPYGLTLVESIDATKPGGMERVARTLNDQLPTERAEGAQARRDGYYAFGAALRLGNVVQWNLVLEATHISENSLFLFHGARDQTVGLFLERIQMFFSQEVARPYGIYRVPFNIRGHSPRTGTDWLAHLRDALQCSGALGPHLGQMVRQRPLFIMLGTSPLPLDRLTSQHIEALGEFITDRLVSLLREAKVYSGVCIILGFDYEKTVPDLIAKCEAWGRAAEATKMLRFRPLPQAVLPTWDEVVEYLRTDVTPPLADAQIELFRDAYDRLVRSPDFTFERLARLIDRYTLTS